VGKTWALQDAKNRFSEVVDRALEEGAQTVTRRGEAVAVVLSVAEYQRLTSGVSRAFVDHLLAMPKGDPLDLERNPSPARDVDFG
jgi:prevent-host-death family protein